MSVIKQGNVSVTNGSEVVTGTGTNWLGQVAQGQVFALVGEVSYTIASVASDTSLTLTVPYGGTTKSGQTYSVTRDFTTGGLPLLAPGTVSASGVLNPVVQALEDLGLGGLKSANNLSDLGSANTARNNLGLGTAATADVQTSPTDATAGRLMAVGAGGWMGVAPERETVDLNNVPVVGRTIALAGGAASNPFGVNTVVLRQAWDSSLAGFDLGVDVAGQDKIAFRGRAASAWRSWQELYHTGNLTKQTSPTDTTAGALMAVGAGGLLVSGNGSAETLSDLTVNISSGSYRCTNSAIGFPAGLPNLNYQVTVGKNSTGRQSFLLQSVTSSEGLQIMYFGGRATNTGSITWRKLYHTGNILGTVSQSGGVPTGAIFEKGGVTSGGRTFYFHKYADGKLSVWWKEPLDIVGTEADTFVYSSGAMTLPVTLAATDTATITVSMDARVISWGDSSERGRHEVMAGINTTTQAQVLVYRQLAGADTFGIAEVQIEGRWY